MQHHQSQLAQTPESTNGNDSYTHIAHLTSVELYVLYIERQKNKSINKRIEIINIMIENNFKREKLEHRKQTSNIHITQSDKTQKQ